jgi:ubiquinone/menaquinone biosynthesis C-methylase UbiE
MNSLEHFFCSSSLWRFLTKRRLLPWVLGGRQLGDHVLELGAGYGAVTEPLSHLAPHVTALEYDAGMLPDIASRVSPERVTVVQGDAAFLPFADGTFSSVVAFLMLHHLKSRELQDQTFAEVQRVLRPGGSFFAFEIQNNLPNRVIHYRTTFVPVEPASTFARLTKAGFAKISVDFGASGYRLLARKAASASGSLPTKALATA